MLVPEVGDNESSSLDCLKGGPSDGGLREIGTNDGGAREPEGTDGGSTSEGRARFADEGGAELLELEMIGLGTVELGVTPAFASPDSSFPGGGDEEDGSRGIQKV